MTSYHWFVFPILASSITDYNVYVKYSQTKSRVGVQENGRFRVEGFFQAQLLLNFLVFLGFGFFFVNFDT